jgi:hypothetical protein
MQGIELDEEELQLATGLVVVDFKASRPVSTVRILDHSATACTKVSLLSEAPSHFLRCVLPELDEATKKEASQVDMSSITYLLVVCLMLQSTTDVETVLKGVVVDTLNKEIINGSNTHCVSNIIELLSKKKHFFYLQNQPMPTSSTATAISTPSKDNKDSVMGRRLFAPASSSEDFFVMSLYEGVGEMLLGKNGHNLSRRMPPKKSARRHKWREKSLQVKLNWTLSEKRKKKKFDFLSQSSQTGIVVCEIYRVLVMLV